ncbi:MAG: hypothetical protein E7161_01805 [Firmicutes bacterium]|nr:hypothetical protein [Bacillota bacterium]
MPALYTHYEFGQRVLKKLNKKVQKEINKNISYYNMFNQGFDNLYYHFRWKYYRNFGILAHKKNIDKFFEGIFKYIENNNLKDNGELTNMIYGFINHYTLDTLIHPFINYQVAHLNVPHTKIEFMLDSQMRNSNKNSIYKILIPKLKFKSELINLLNYVFETAHNKKNIGKVFNRSHNNGYYIYRYFINDRFGIKTFLYKIIDFLTPFKDIKLHQNTFYTKNFDDRIFNKDKFIWHHPNNIKETYNYSFAELYDISLKIYINLNNDAYKVLHGKKDVTDFIDTIKLINLKNIATLLKK